MKPRAISLVIALLSGASSSILAEVIHVPGDAPTIQGAILLANTGDEIRVAPGVYHESIDLMGKQIILRGEAGAAATSLTGVGGSVITCASGETLDTVIEGLTVTGGSGTYLAASAECNVLDGLAGGGVFVGPGASLTVRSCRFVGNGAGAQFGGAIQVADGSLRVHDCEFIDNGDPFETTYGGAINVGGSWYPSACPAGEVEVLRSSFRGNSGDFGGGLRVGSAARLIVEDCRFQDNSASFGGGIASHVNTEATISRCLFEGNTASHAGGLQLQVANQQAARIQDCQFRANIANSRAGGLLAAASSGDDLRPNGSITIDRCVMSANIAGDAGGGAELTISGGGSITLANSLIVGNQSVHPEFSRGGGVNTEAHEGGRIDLVQCTISENVAEYGAGIHAVDLGPGQIRASGCIVYGNIGTPMLGTLSAAYCDVQGGWAGPGNIAVDPGFADAGAGDFRLAPASPCVDASDNSAIPAGITLDLDGAARFIDDPDAPDTGIGPPPIADMGAYERQADDACPADLDGDGDADSEDFFLFLDLFASHDGRADIDSDGDLDGDDFFGFLDLFVQGCS